MALIGITLLADTPFQINTSALLYDVSSFVRCRMQIGSATERDIIPARIGMRAHLCIRSPRRIPIIRFDAGHVVPPERLLDRVEVR